MISEMYRSRTTVDPFSRSHRLGGRRSGGVDPPVVDGEPVAGRLAQRWSTARERRGREGEHQRVGLVEGIFDVVERGRGTVEAGLGEGVLEGDLPQTTGEQLGGDGRK